MHNDWKYAFIRTPLQRPLEELRGWAGLRKRRRKPELATLYRNMGLTEQVLRSALKRDSNVIDIGAHYGALLARMIRWAPKGRHLAYEPVPDKIPFLQRKFPEVDVRHKALTDQSGRCRFHIHRERSARSGLFETRAGKYDTIEIDAVRLDDDVPDDRTFHFVKMDVEGAELNVFRGGSRFFQQHRPIIMFECGPAGQHAFGYTLKDLYTFVTDELGYDICFFDGWLANRKGLSLDEFEQALVYPYKSFDWLAQPR